MDASLNPTPKKRKLIAENSRFHVFLDELVQNGQRQVADYLSVVPKQRTANSVTGVAVLPVSEGKIGLIKIYRYPLQELVWEIPRGFVEPGEDSMASALRELEEETGLSCEPEAVHSLGFVTPDPGILMARVHIFAALQCVRISPYVSNELGHQEFQLFTPARVKEMLASSEIQDAVTVAACLKYFSQLSGKEHKGK